MKWERSGCGGVGVGVGVGVWRCGGVVVVVGWRSDPRRRPPLFPSPPRSLRGFPRGITGSRVQRSPHQLDALFGSDRKRKVRAFGPQERQLSPTSLHSTPHHTLRNPPSTQLSLIVDRSRVKDKTIQQLVAIIEYRLIVASRQFQKGVANSFSKVTIHNQ
ncbi:uncharacterized protein LOC143917281 [Arctopsyche grandis]|uniref:uncharacterized protein LOC143917281 n=1 Tax=Arctopsyche grandis TaxID=121162 RepID=UPI00406D9742